MATSAEAPPDSLAAAGKEARQRAPRASHGEWEAPERDAGAILAEQDVSRVPELVPIRYQRMLESPFAFYRGGAAVMAADLAATPVAGFDVQLCGDAGYRQAMRRFAAMRNLEVWYARIDVEERAARLRRHLDERRAREVERNLEKARSRDSLRALRKLTVEEDGALRIVSQPPLIVPLAELTEAADAEAQLQQVLDRYRATLADDRQQLLGSYRYVDAARKVVGVGSVGTRAWIVLLLGRDGGDPLFLQAKEAQSSVLEPFAGKSRFANRGQRVVEGQRLMQAASDILLGWIHTTGIDGLERDFYIRQLWDAKGSVSVETLRPAGMHAYAEL